MGLSLFKRSRSMEAPVPGAVYRRVLPGNVVETARVVAITDRGLPLPHVRFVLRNAVIDGATEGTVRILSLDSFHRAFSKSDVD